MNKKKNQLLNLLLLFLLSVPFLINGQGLLKVPKPTHSDKGVVTSRLALVKEITVDFDTDLFFALPWDLAVNKEGNRQQEKK